MIEKLVSVLIPVYNVENFVEEAIQSILLQTYQNLEIIVIDDASSDTTYSIVENLAQKDDRIHLYKNNQNLRIVKTLNRALSLANGEYIARMDGDDISMPDRIEKLVDFLEKNHAYHLVGSSYIGIDEHGVVIGETFMPEKQTIIEQTLLYSSPVSHIWLARKKVYDLLDGYRADTVEDYDFLLRMKTAGLLFGNISDFLYKVRLRHGNTASTQGLRQAKAVQYIKNLYQERLKSGKDSYSELAFNSFTCSNTIENELHKHSQKYLHKAILTSSKVNKIYFSLLSMLLSPYTSGYILRRLKYKYIIKKNLK